MESYEYEMTGDRLLIHMPKEIDDHVSQEIRSLTEKCLERREIKHLIFDLTDTVFMDSAGVGMMIGRYKRMKGREGQAWVLHGSPQIHRILRIGGIEKLMPEWKGQR